MPSKLPQELVDQAIDHLWNDRESLLACSLTCHSWLPSARTHLFRDLRLTGATHCDRFEALLGTAPDVARFVRKLAINEPRSTAYAQHWIARVPSLVARLPSLATLEFVGLHYVSLRDTPPAALVALERLTALVFADVYFDTFADLHALLSAARGLRDLCFYRVSWLNPSCVPADDSNSSAALVQPLPLRRLVLDSWASSVMLQEWLLPRCAGHLDVRTLMVRWRERDCVDVLNALLRACGPALEDLYVELPTSMEESQELPSLAHNTGLRTLEIDGLVVPGCAAWTSAILGDLRAPGLEKLSVSMLVLNGSSISSFDWDGLDGVLSQPSFVDTTLNININLALHSSNDPRAVRDAVTDHLPGAQQREKLCVRCA
ncbi:hypothetical protein C8Q79DRAFT_1009659 [Trametes meyenii]|nr:hypothetical protein C8Q79DRAFT_1009659 [Trametes meyenii]